MVPRQMVHQARDKRNFKVLLC